MSKLKLHMSGGMYSKTTNRISLYHAEVVADGNKLGNVTFDDMYDALKEKGFEVIDLQGKHGLSFGDAIRRMQDGKKVARSGWNGKGMFLYYVPAYNYPALTEVAKQTFGDAVPYGAYIAMKTAQGNVVPWLASQTDVLASDWEVVD